MDDIQRVGNVSWNPFCMNFIKKNLSNILLVLFALFLFTPYGLPVRALLIKGVSVVTTNVFDLEVDESERKRTNRLTQNGRHQKSDRVFEKKAENNNSQY